MRELRTRDAGAQVDLGRGQDRPGVGRDDIAPGRHVARVHLADVLRRPVQRPGPPELRIGLGLASTGAEALDLGRDSPVEDDAALAGDQLLDAAVGARSFERLLHRHIIHAAGNRAGLETP